MNSQNICATLCPGVFGLQNHFINRDLFDYSYEYATLESISEAYRSRNSKILENLCRIRMKVSYLKEKSEIQEIVITPLFNIVCRKRNELGFNFSEYFFRKIFLYISKRQAGRIRSLHSYEIF